MIQCLEALQVFFADTDLASQQGNGQLCLLPFDRLLFGNGACFDLLSCRRQRHFEIGCQFPGLSYTESSKGLTVAQEFVSIPFDA